MAEIKEINNEWAKFFDKESLKENIVRSSLYLFSYELLRNSIVDKIKDLYIIGIDKGEFKYSDRYNETIVNRKVNGKQNIFLSSLEWLKENGCISSSEAEEITSIREHRNDIAHRIDKILFDIDYQIDETKEKRIFELIKKIEHWWIREIEIPTDETLCDKEISDDEIIAGKEIFYAHIKSVCDELIVSSKTTQDKKS